jgi:predicted MFS family arabinose efflux permease
LFWLGESVNRLGTAVIGVLLPLFAVETLNAGPVSVGLLLAATWAPWLAIGLPVGAMVDRLPARPVLLAASLVSAAALTVMGVASWAGAASIPVMLVVALTVGAAGVFASTASVVYWPSLVSGSDLIEGNAKLQASEAAALVLGPSLGGLLAQTVGPGAGLLVGAVGFVCSAACLLAVSQRATVARDHRKTGFWREIGEGIRIVAGDALLCAMAVKSTIANLSMSATEVLVVVFLVRTVGVNTATAGFLLGLWGIGGLIGALIARRVSRWLGTARTLLITSAVAAPFGLLIPLTTPGSGLVLFAIGAIVPLTGVTIANTVSGAFRQHYCTPETLGRVTATTKFVLYGAVPLGALLGGFLGAELGPRQALWFTMATGLLPAVILMLSPIGRIRDLPVRQS